jgi:hypothetical protein
VALQPVWKDFSPCNHRPPVASPLSAKLRLQILKTRYFAWLPKTYERFVGRMKSPIHRCWRAVR